MSEHPEMGGSTAPEWSTRVEIPATLDELRAVLTDLGSAIGGHCWHRAAGVYAFTREGDPGERVDLSRSELHDGLTPREFAELAIKGLNSDQTVRRYRRTWGAAMELGACVEAKPGMTVDLPDLDWDEMYRTNAGGAHVGPASGDNEWNTPAVIIAAARAVLGEIDLDPCSTELANMGNGKDQPGVGAKTFYTKEQDGLAQEWAGRVFMNPPYAQPLIAQFCAKLAEEHMLGHVSAAVVLINNATDTDWWQDLAMVASGFCFPRGRLRFWHASGILSQPLQGQSIVYLGDDHGKFAAEFSALGAQDKGWIVL